jgi:hypothetical protein
MTTRTSCFYTYTFYFLYTYILSYQISKKTCSLYSQQACNTATENFYIITESVKRFRYLQVWFKSSDIWRWLSGLKWEHFQKLRFWCSSKRALNTSLFIFLVSKSFFIFLMPVCEEHQNLNFWKSSSFQTW